MTVKELRDILKDFDDDVDVITKKTEYPWYQLKDMHKEVVDKFGIM